MNQTVKENLLQIKSLLIKIDDCDYAKKREILSSSSIGDHVRHVLEFYKLLVCNAFTDRINYDNRERNLKLASETEFACAVIDEILEEVHKVDIDKTNILESDYSRNGKNNLNLKTTIGRELAFCIEHSIHHQALIKTALIAIKKTDLIDENFGLAYSTIRFRKSLCAQ